MFCLIKGRPSTFTENEKTALTMLEEKEKEYDQLLKEVEMHESYLLTNLLIITALKTWIKHTNNFVNLEYCHVDGKIID